MKILMHYHIVKLLHKAWPDLFKRYYDDYEYVKLTEGN